MLKALEFFFLVVVPIWSVTTLITRWIEDNLSEEFEAMDMHSLANRSRYMTIRIEALEDSVGERRGRAAEVEA